ncbi:MAG: hypothetical protein LBU50_05735, partial [Cellulomonas sp.]|nr:hypothetical protein [Cellulomonas sp.]
MSYPYPPPYPPPYQLVPRPLPTSTAGPKVLTFVGIAVLVLAIAMGVGGGVAVASGASSVGSLSEIDLEVDSAALVTIQPGQTETVELTAHTEYELWLGTDAGTDSGSRPTVTGPDGDSILVSTSRYTSSSWEDDESLRGWGFTSQAAGRYEITTASDGPALQLVPGIEFDKLIGGVTTGA